MRTLLMLTITAVLAVGGTTVPTAPTGGEITTFGVGCCKAAV